MGLIESVESRMTAGRGFPRRIVAHVFHVPTPRPADRVQLIRKGLDGGGIDAATANRLSVRSDTSQSEILEDLAVITRLLCGRLTTKHGNVVVQANMARAVILVQQDSLAGQSLGKVRSLGVRAERDIKSFVFQDDDKNVFNPVAEIIVVVW